MCIAIYKDAGKLISKATLQECFDSNPDGAGFLYVENRKLHLQKGFFTFEEFYEAYLPHEEKQCLIHFRIKTHGKINADMCHPFMVTNNLGFIHNGVITGYSNGDTSDTYQFNEEVLQPLVEKFGRNCIHNPALKELIEDRIGYSKLVFLDANGKYEIYNESKGVWDAGVWYSNTSYRPVVTNQYSYSRRSSFTDAEFDDYEDLSYSAGRRLALAASSTSYYLDKKGMGKNIYKDDFARVAYDFNGLQKDDIVEVVYISAAARCTIKKLDGSYIFDFPGGYLEYYDAYTPVEVPNEVH